MPNPATPLDAETLKAALLSRGMLADRGRYTPFAGIAGTNADAGLTGAPAPLNSDVVGNAASGDVSSSPSPDAANPNAAGSTALPVDDNTLDGMSEGDVAGLLAALGLGGAALAAYLMRRRNKLNSNVPGSPNEAIPVVEGEDIGVAPKAKDVGDNIVNGEVVERNVPIANTKKITQGTTVPDNEGIKALDAPKEVDVPRLSNQSDVTKSMPPRYTGNRATAAQAIAARSARVQRNDMETIPLTDAMSDITPQEMEQAKGLVAQMRQNRLAGNAANVRRMTGKRELRSTLPTGTVNENKLLNIVIGLMRSGKFKPQTVARVIP